LEKHKYLFRQLSSTLLLNATFQTSKNRDDQKMVALSALKVGGGSPNVCFAALRPSTKNFGQSASRQKYVSYARCSKSTTEQNDVVFKLPISTSDGFAFGLIHTLTKLRAKKPCLLSRCIPKCIRYLRNFSHANISRILNPMGRYRCCVTSYLRSHARGSNLDTRKAMCS
jgi:hypothetical protein